MNDEEKEMDIKKHIESTILSDHKYCLEKCDEIIKEKDKQLRRKDIIIIILSLLLGIAFCIHQWGYFKTPAIKNQVQLIDSDGNKIGYIERGNK